MTASEYPPPRHVLRDLDITTELIALDRSVAAAPCDVAVRDAGGGASLGFLAALVDVGAALVALVAGQPKWTATVNLELHAAGRVPTGAVVSDARLLRAGSNVVVVAANVYDTAGEDLDAVLDEIARTPFGAVERQRSARGLLTFARIPRSASLAEAQFDPESMMHQRRHMASIEAPSPGSLADRVGLRILDAHRGVVEIDRSDYVANSFGTINGGVHGVVLQAAAEALLPGFVTTDLQIHYLAQAKQGPARTTTDLVRVADDHAVCEVTLHDAGHEGLVMSVGTVSLRRVG